MAIDNENTNNIFDKEYPENAADNVPDNAPNKRVAPPRDVYTDISHMGAVYAGPDTINMMLKPTPIMAMVYAGPDAMANGIGIPNGFTIPGIGMTDSATVSSPGNTANSKTCPACGALVRAEAKFCTECGTQLVQKTK